MKRRYSMPSDEYTTLQQHEKCCNEIDLVDFVSFYKDVMHYDQGSTIC